MIEEGTDLDVKITCQKPGVSANLIFGSVRIGGGVFKYYSQIE